MLTCRFMALMSKLISRSLAGIMQIVYPVAYNVYRISCAKLQAIRLNGSAGERLSSAQFLKWGLSCCRMRAIKCKKRTFYWIEHTNMSKTLRRYEYLNKLQTLDTRCGNMIFLSNIEHCAEKKTSESQMGRHSNEVANHEKWLIAQLATWCPSSTNTRRQTHTHTRTLTH